MKLPRKWNVAYWKFPLAPVKPWFDIDRMSPNHLSIRIAHIHTIMFWRDR